MRGLISKSASEEQSNRKATRLDRLLAGQKDALHGSPPNQSAGERGPSRGALNPAADRQTAESGPKGDRRETNAPPVLIVVEDDEDDFALLKRALWKAGATARVWWVRDADEALLLLAQFEPVVARICIVSDVHLMGTDGFELLHRVKERPKGCRVKFVFLTGDQSPHLVDRAMRQGADGFLTKGGSAENWIEIARQIRTLICLKGIPA